jgi:type IV secretion system protein VirB9
MKTRFVVLCLALSLVLPLHADTTARTIVYHAKDIVNIRAKVKYTTLIQLPATEKIIEAATGDKEFWIIDVVGSFCFVHPAKSGIHSNLNLIPTRATSIPSPSKT